MKTDAILPFAVAFALALPAASVCRAAPAPDVPPAPVAATAADTSAAPSASAPAADAAVRLPEVVVTATRRETLLGEAPGAVQVIGRSDIEEINPTSTGELIEYVTGTFLQLGTGSGHPKRSVVGLGGMPANYTLVLVDGVRLLSEHVHTGVNIEMIPPRNIERIEVIRGAAAAQYGSDAIAGVVNIITRKCGDTPAAEADFAGGSYSTFQGGALCLTPLGKHVRLSLSMGWDQSDGVPLLAPASRIGKMGYQRFHALGRLDAGLTDAVDAFAAFRYTDSTMDWANDTTDSYLASGSAGFTARLSDSVEWFTQLSYSRWKAEVAGEKNQLLQPETRFTWRISDAHTFSGGFDLKHLEFTREAVAGVPSQDTYGVYVQHEWKPAAPLTILVALRFDHVEDIDSVVTPMLSAVYSPDLPLRVRASVGRGFHAPTPQELYEEGYGHGGRALRFGNPDLEPEHSTTFTAGLELFPDQPFEFFLLGYFNELDDMIVPVYEGAWSQDPSKDVWRRTNISEARVWGIEARARYTFTPGFRIEAGYTHSEGEDTGAGRPLPYEPGSTLFAKLVAGTGLGADWSWSAHLGIRAVFGRSAWNWKPAAGAPAGDTSGLTTPLDDYQDVEAGVKISYKERYSLFLNVYNLLGQDFENLDDAYTVQDGEPTVVAGIQAKW